MSEFGRVCERRKLRENVGKSKVMRCSRYVVHRMWFVVCSSSYVVVVCGSAYLVRRMRFVVCDSSYVVRRISLVEYVLLRLLWCSIVIRG